MGRSYVTYLQVFDDMLVKSAGAGLRGGVNLGPLSATLHESFQDVQFFTNDWLGHERD